MIRNNYEIISDLDGVQMAKKDNKYKIQFKTELNKIDKIIEILKKNKFYELNYLLNKDIIEKYQMENVGTNNFEIYYLFSLIDDDEYEEYDKYYLKLSNVFKMEESKSKFIYIIDCANNNELTNSINSTNSTNSINSNEPNENIQVKLDNLKITIIIDKNNSELYFELKFNYSDKKIVSYVKKTVGLFFNKSISRLKKYLQE